MNLPDLLTELGIDFKRHGESPHVTANFVGVVCPFCGVGTGRYGMGIPIDRPTVALCWKCGSHKPHDALAELSGKSVRECLALLKGIAPESLPEERVSGKLILPDGLGPLQAVHRKYLKRRNFAPDELERLWGVQGIGLSSRLAWRLFIPVCNRDGKTVSWTTRAVSDEATKRYINARPEEEAVPIKHTLYGIQYVTHSCVIVEGPTDVWRIGKGAICTFGLNVTQEQRSIIRRIPCRTFCFDSETQAQRRSYMEALYHDVAIFPGQTRSVELDAPDPGSASEKEIKELRKRFLD